MLSAEATRYLSSLEYSPQAKRLSCMFPLGGIHWVDEFPNDEEGGWRLFRTDASTQSEIFTLYVIRRRIWKHETLTEKEQQFWNEALAACPLCPLFQRLQLSPEDWAALEAAERSLKEEVLAVELRPRYTLRRAPRKSWWKRWLGKC